jgi:UPF0755 protein
MLPAMSSPHRAARPRRAGSGMILLLVLALLVTGGVWVYQWSTEASGPQSPVMLTVPEGATTSDVAERLERAGVIRASWAFGFAARLRGLSEDLQAGRYQLTTNMPVGDVLDALEEGPIVEEVVTVTFPEGLELRDVAEHVDDEMGLSANLFQKRATSGRFSLPPYLPDGTDTLEGFLFPKTYDFPADAPVDDVILRLLVQFEEEVAKLPWDRAEDLGLTPYEVVIVASMIEREARIPGDRAKVSAVIHNRLAAGMRLQIDATVQYAIPGPNRLLTFEDYEYESPYNTYLNDGLPPTPVASPGLAALRAALEPADADYLFYFVVDEETGAHRFYESEEAFCADAPGC